MRRSLVLGFVAALLVVANVVSLTHARVAFLTPALEFAALIGIPTFLIAVVNPGQWSDRVERLVMSSVLSVLLVMFVGLAANGALPRFGVTRPLDTVPITVCLDVVFTVLGILAFRALPTRVRIATFHSTPKGRVLVSSAVALIGISAMGAVRLNNDAGGGLALFALVLATVLLGATYRWRDQVGPAVVPFVVYCAALALLFATSLRGWYTTGHDVQHEMNVFLLTSDRGRWTIGLRDAYNSCLSITILPTILSRWTRVADPYVFKVFFQMLYATCPVIGYLLAKRVANPKIALLGAIYFIGFVGFTQDMPMLNRQEIGFLFFAAAVLSLFISEHSSRRRRTMFAAMAVGMVVSHYSTSYFAFGAFLITWAAIVFLRWLARRAPRVRVLDGRPIASAGVTAPPAVTFLMVLGLGLTIAVWGGPLTHAGSGVPTVLKSTVRALTGQSDSLRDPGASYALVGGGSTTNATQNLRDAAEQLRRLRAAAPPGTYYAAALPDSQSLPEATQASIPLTWLGERLDSVGLPVKSLNSGLRTGIAVLLQLLLLVGLLAGLSRRWGRSIEPAYLAFAVGLTVPIILQILLPGLSLDYGVPRSFMQALLVVGPFQVLGTLVVAAWFSRLGRVAAAAVPAVALVYFTSSTGLAPQALGAYPPQMHLNNAGQYYDRFYTHPGDVAVLEWANGIVQSAAPYPDIQMDPGMFNRRYSVGRFAADNNILPAAVRRDSFVVLGYSNVVDHKVEVSEVNYQLWYTYEYSPEFLDDAKDRVYDNGTARVYR